MLADINCTSLSSTHMLDAAVKVIKIEEKSSCVKMLEESEIEAFKAKFPNAEQVLL